MVYEIEDNNQIHIEKAIDSILKKLSEKYDLQRKLQNVNEFNSGDTAWMLTSTALVLLMTIPGLALFYGGMVETKNVLSTLMQNFMITCLITFLWLCFGYSMAFAPVTAEGIYNPNLGLYNGTPYQHNHLIGDYSR